MNMRRVLICELLLIIASVLIFRGLWMLMDKIKFMNSDWAMVGSLIVGVLVTIKVLVVLNEEMKKK